MSSVAFVTRSSFAAAHNKRVQLPVALSRPARARGLRQAAASGPQLKRSPLASWHAASWPPPGFAVRHTFDFRLGLASNFLL